ncbi:MAG: sigma-54 dependent transcriptional regulator [Bryobacteraceae bacterium]|jgi:two-component system response regulator AtoC
MRDGKSILVVEDDADARNYLEMVVRCFGYGAAIAEDGEEALACLAANRAISLVLLDLEMPHKDGLETLREMRNAGRNQPVIMLSEAASTTNVVQAIKTGATDFLAKPIDHDHLILAIRSALEGGTQAVAPDVESHPSEPEACLTESWMGKDMRAAWRRVAASDLPLLIEGETGAGKEVLARRIHAQSPRARKPFLKVNCAALPGELAENELAHGGAILLDEIGDMDIRLQGKLVRVLEDNECERPGGKDRIPLDVRVMAATQCDLRKAIDAGRFRADLYYRLNVVNIRVPALRERKADIPAAAEFFLRKHRTEGPSDSLLSPALRQAMLEYEWPGNLREMENMMRRLLVLQDPDEIVRQLSASAHGSLPDGVIRFQPAGAASSIGSSLGFPSLEKVNEAKRKAETEAILRALDASRWNRKQAAKILRIDYKALLYKMHKLEIDHSADDLRSAAGGA